MQLFFEEIRNNNYFKVDLKKFNNILNYNICIYCIMQNIKFLIIFKERFGEATIDQKLSQNNYFAYKYLFLFLVTKEIFYNQFR